VVKILAADIGGTNSRFAQFIVEGPSEGLTLLDTKWLGTRECGSFSELVQKLRSSDFPLKPEEADMVALAVAGPVERGAYSSPPLISWDVDLSDATREFGFRECVMINDFVAQAYATRSPIGLEAEQMLEGEALDGAPVVVIGAGTGLGKATLVSDGSGGYTAIPSEGGHANFPFVGDEECRYQDFLIKEFGEEYLTLNIVVSGRGLSLLHRFHTGEELDPEEVSKRLVSGSATLEWFSSFYGRICRNFALEVLAEGGVYIAGGVAARNPVLVKHEAFEQEFRSSKAHAGLLGKMPVFLVRDENSGLWGAAFLAHQVLKRKGKA
jgi:glucokinase